MTTVADVRQRPRTAYPLREPQAADVITAMASRSGFSVKDLVGKSRRRPLVGYRQVAMAACRLVTSCSYPTIGRAFGDRDHTTVISACKRVAADPHLAAMARQLADDVLTEERGGGLKLHLQSTSRIVEVDGGRGVVPGRVWEGVTDSGIQVTCIITRIAVDRSDDTSRFEAELARCRTGPPPAVHTDAFPARLVL